MAKNEATKEIIAKAAISCFAKQGLTNTSIQEIANEANVSKSLVFYYYKNKENLFINLVQKQQIKNLEKLKEIINKTNDPLEQFSDIIENMLSSLKEKEHLDVLKIVHSEFIKNPFNQIKNELENHVHEMINLISSVIDKGIEKGYFRKINSKLVTINIFSFMFFIAISLSQVQESNNKKQSRMIPIQRIAASKKKEIPPAMVT